MRRRQEYDEVRDLVRAAQRPEDAQARVVLYLYENFGHYDWVGIYRLEKEDLVLGPWHGEKPTEHVRIPKGQGICGACAVTCKTEVVPDVNADARYLACFSETRSEIVVPVIKDGAFWGEIDIDSSERSAFGPDDVEFLEAVAKLLADVV